MASKIPSTFVFPSSKRSACDRCRKQKLRCPVRANETESCSRCVRAGVPCITGYTRPLGRSGQGAASSNLSHGGYPYVARMTPIGTFSSPSTPRTMSIALTDSSVGDTASSSWLLAEGCEDLHSLAHDRYVFDALSGCSVLPLSPRYSVEEGDHLYLRSPHHVQTDRHMSFSESIIMEETQQPSIGGVGGILSEAECDLRLSQLSVDLCRQVQFCMATAQQPDDSTDMDLVAENPFQTMRQCPNGQSSSNAFADALCSTSEFLAIFQSNPPSAASNDSRPTSSHDPQPSQNFTCILNLVSCYLRIIAIFDILLLRLYERLRHSNGPFSSAESGGPQAIPGLHLAGFPVQQGILQTKILIQTIEHQFEMIEKSLGLPVELRVSDRRDVYPNGLLHCELDSSLLQDLFVRLGSALARTSASGDQTHVVGSPASLRENIMKVRRFLDT